MTSKHALAVLGMSCAVLPRGCGPGEPDVEVRQDLWVTNTSTTSKQTFASTPIPAGFFDFDGRSCDSLGGEADFVGAAVNPSTTGMADTVVNRSADPVAVSDPVGTENTVEVQITNLNLWSADPIMVMCDGEPTQWRVQAALSDIGQRKARMENSSHPRAAPPRSNAGESRPPMRAFGVGAISESAHGEQHPPPVKPP